MDKAKIQSVPTSPYKMELSNQGETRSLSYSPSKAPFYPLTREKENVTLEGKKSVNLTGRPWKWAFPLKKAPS